MPQVRHDTRAAGAARRHAEVTRDHHALRETDMINFLLLALALVPLLARSAGALDLDGVLREVASANPTLSARRQMVEAARRRIAPAGAWQSPMVELGAINVPTSGRFDMDPMTMRMVGVSQRVPVFGSNRLNRSSVRAAAAAEGAASEMAHYELFSMAWEAYGDVYYADQLVHSASAHQAEMDRLVRSAEARYQSGSGRLEDLLRAQAERARTVSDLVSFEAESRGARARLGALMGRDSGPLVDSLSAPPLALVPGEPAAWTAAIGPTHPRIRDLQGQVDRYRLAARAARRMVWPDLQLGASYAKRQPIDGVAQDNMWTATVGFMLPIFAVQREFSEGAEMDAMARANEAEMLATRLDLIQQVLAAHASALSDQRAVTLLADTVVTTQQRAVSASWSSYGAGATDLWRVFEATHALYGEQVALVRARQDLVRTEARVLAITARGDLLGVNLPVIRSGPE